MNALYADEDFNRDEDLAFGEEPPEPVKAPVVCLPEGWEPSEPPF
ncbi:hypothetical protein [Nonomuraea rubra]